MKNITRIEDYLDGQLSAAERSFFEADLLTDPELADAHSILQEARVLLAEHWSNCQQEAALSKTLKSLGKGYFGKHRSRWAPLRQAGWWLLPLAVGLILWLIWPRAEPKPSAPMLFARHFHPALDFSAARSEGEAPDQLEQAYQQGDYARVLALITSRQSDKDSAAYNSFYFLQLGQVLLLNHQPEAARAALLKVQNGYVQQRQWYLAMSALAANDPASARQILQGIAVDEGPFQAEARVVLEALK